MASSKISELVDGTQFEPGDETIIVRGGANFKVDPTINAVNAWVNFNGTGTVAIRASYNVSSITDNGTGDYTVNFTNALTDANYSAVCSSGVGSGGSRSYLAHGPYAAVPTTTAFRLVVVDSTSAAYADIAYVLVAIVR